MTSLQAVLLLSIGITLAVAGEFDAKKECEHSSVKYSHGIGFLKLPHQENCATYVMCFKKPYSTGYYRGQFMCCPVGTEFDLHHLTCVRNPKCDDNREKCPNATTTTDLPCPFKKDASDERKYIYKATHEEGSCAYKSYFDEELCTCIFQGPYKPPCRKLLNFNFTNSYDSHSCYNWAVGLPYGFPNVTGNQLCLNGQGQYFQIPFLNNWWAWNPVARTFTICFWMRLHEAKQTAGIFATNVDVNNIKGDDIASFWLKGGELIVNLGGDVKPTGKEINDRWNLYCVTFTNGHIIFFLNAGHLHQFWLDPDYKISSHTDTTLGVVPGIGKPEGDTSTLKGYFDDFMFWTRWFPKDPDIIDMFENTQPTNDSGDETGDQGANETG